MKVRLPFFALMTGLVLVMKAPAAPAEAAAPAPTAPAITIQVQAIDGLLDAIKTAANNFLPAEAYQEFDKNFLSKIDPNKLKGVDTSKPIGLYTVIGKGLLQADFSTSSIVVLVPISDQKEFINLLTGIGMKPETKGEVYEIPIPMSPFPATLRFANGYAYVSLSTAPIETKNLLSPKELFEEKIATAAKLKIRIDRVPDDIKTKGLEMLEDQFDATIQEDKKNAGDPVGKVREELMRTTAAWLKMGSREGKELAVAFNLDPKGGAVINEITIEAKRGTELAGQFNALKASTNTFTGIIGSDSAASLMMTAPLANDRIKKIATDLVDAAKAGITKKIGENPPPPIQDLATELIKTLERTVAGGTIDMAANLRGPDNNGQFTLVAALSMKDPSELEKAIRALLAAIPQEDADKFKLDIFTVEGVNVHEVLVEDRDPKAEKVFGKSSVYVALAPSAVFVTFGPAGKEAMKEMLAKKFVAKPSPLILADASGKRLAALVKTVGGPEDAGGKAVLAKWGQMDRIPVFSVKAESGPDKVTIRTDIGIAALFFVVSSQKDEAAKPIERKPAK